jgi:hypothetical protein
MATTLFSLATMPFASNLLTDDEWTQVGYAELAATAEITAGDYSEIFYAILALMFGVNAEKYSTEDLFTEIFSVKSAPTDTDRRLVEEIYGGRIKRKDQQLLLICGSRQFPVTQQGENLICGNVSGRLVSVQKSDALGKKYHVLEWSPKASYGDKSFRYTIPVALGKVNDRHHQIDIDLLEEIADKNNLIEFVESVGAGGQYFKAYDLVEGLGIATFKVVDVSVKPSNKEDFLDNVVFTLEDGRKVNANSQAQKYFIELSEADRKASIPCLWTINKYAEKKCKSSVESLGRKVGSTRVPSLAHLIGGSTADFEKLEAAQKPVATIEPTKSAAPVAADGSSNDDCF